MTSATRIAPRALADYAEARGLSERAAGDELLRIMADARESPKEPGRWRYRNRADHLDVTARVVNGCVIAVTVRGYAAPRGGRHRAP